jgi:hypothetical protein
MKVKDNFIRHAMFKCLGDVMHTHKNVDVMFEEANKFLNDFQEETIFIVYFQAQWLDIIGLALYYNFL